MSGAAWAGIVLGVCGVLSSLLGLYIAASGYFMSMALREKWSYLLPMWMPTTWILAGVRRVASKFAKWWIAKRGFDKKILKSEMRDRMDTAVFWIVLGAAFLGVGSLLVGLVALIG